MAGASLMPDYFNSKMNVCVFFAPPASLHQNPSKLLKTLAEPHILKGIEDILLITSNYNLIPYHKDVKKNSWSVCSLFNGAICNLALSWFIDLDPSIDYTGRYDVFMSNVPSGAGYKDFEHYGQNMNGYTPSFKRFDHGTEDNFKKYG